MPVFLENKLKSEGRSKGFSGRRLARYVFGAMNDVGAMHGNQETAKGAEMQRKHDEKMEDHMGVLNAAERKRIPSGSFGLPKQRKYPMPDRAHAANAKARATQMEERGRLSPEQAAEIRAKANRKLKGGK